MSFSHLPGVRVAAGLAGALFLVAPAAADEPGPGGIRPRIPVTGEEVYRATCAACAARPMGSCRAGKHSSASGGGIRSERQR